MKHINKVVIKLAIIVFLVVAIFFIIPIYKQSAKISESYDDSYNLFLKIIKHVEDNQDYFQQLSEYEFSLTTLNDDYSILREGDLQETRNKVFNNYIRRATIKNKEGALLAQYFIDTSSHTIIITYGKDISKNKTDNDNFKIINNNLYVCIQNSHY